MKGKKSSFPYCRGREMYIDQCSLNERIELAWFRLRIWKLRGEDRRAQKGRPSGTKKRMWFIYS
jgi:hypothetical protein